MLSNETATYPPNLAALNQAAVARRNQFLAQIADGTAQWREFQKLKHEFPFIGFVECEVEGLHFSLFSCNDDVVAWEYFWTGGYEAPIVRKWVEWSRAASSVLDIGAYTGLMSIIAALANPKASVHAFEPVDRTVERMKINVRSNGLGKNIVLHNRAAGAEYGLDMINYYRDEDFLGTGNSIIDKGKDIRAKKIIQTVNLDHYVGSKSTFDLVKIDVEGFEDQALTGMRRMLARDKPRLVLESWQENREYCFDLLTKVGYRFTPLEREDKRVVNYLCECS